MAWLKRLFEAIQSFAARAYKAPIWLIMTFIVISCVSFLVSYQSSGSDEQARLENSNTEWEVWAEDTDRMAELSDHVLVESDASLKTSKQFLPIMLDIIWSGQWANRRQQIEEHYSFAVETRKRVEILIARLEGTHFREPVYNDQTATLKALLANNINALKFMEDFGAAYMAGDIEKFAQEIRRSGSRAETIIIEGETALARQRSVSMQLESTSRSKKTEHDRSLAQAERHRKMGLLPYPAFVFSVGYLLAICYGVRTCYQKPFRAVPRQKRALRKPEKRRRKR